MASRPVFISNTVRDRHFVDTRLTEFTWFAGMAKSQKQKSIRSLHQRAVVEWGVEHVLEISSKSETQLGTDLSAFFLRVPLPNDDWVPLENVFQSSKVFGDAGPFVDLLKVTPLDSKRDPRIRSSGALTAFRYFGRDWPLEPKTVFYDWLYVNALAAQPRLAERVVQYDAFTDIEFNPKKSINCQAYSAALFCALAKRSLLDEAQSPDNFIRLAVARGFSNSSAQPSLI